MKRLAILILVLWISPLCSGQEQDIFQAVQSGQLDKVEELLKANPLAVNATDDAGRSLLHLAAIEGHVDVLDLLIRTGLKVEERDQSGATALDYARRYGHFSAAGFLSKYGGKGEAGFPRLNEPLTIGGLKCTVRPSYANHSCSVLECDGLTIVWLTGVSDNYLVQRRDAGVIDRLALDGVRPHILLLGNPTGIGPEIGNGIREAYLEARKLRPRAAFAFGHGPLERRVLGQIRRRTGETAGFHCAGNPGDVFVLSGGEIE